MLGEKEERKRIGPSLKKQINELIKVCDEFNKEMNKFAKSGKDKDWVERTFPNFKEKIDNNIRLAKEIEQKNFIAKHGDLKGNVYTVKSCEADIALLEEAYSNLIEIKGTCESGEDNLNDWSKKLELLKSLNEEFNKKLKQTENIASKKLTQADYTTFFKDSKKKLDESMEVIKKELDFFKKTNALAKNPESEVFDKLAAEIKARVSQDIQSRQNASSGGILWNTLTAIGDTLSSIYSYFFG